MGVAASTAAAAAMRATCASAESLVIGPVARPAEPMVVFYRLSYKFVDNESSVPDKDTSDIMYYTLAVGHHTGVIDCFGEGLSCPKPVYAEVCGLIADERARYKLGGILRSGEIQVGQEDLPTLLPAVREALENGTPAPSEAALAWLRGFAALLEAMVADKVLYLMGRERS